MSKEHVIHDVVVDNRGLVHQSGHFPPGATLLDPFEQEDKAVHGTEHTTYVQREHLIYNILVLCVCVCVCLCVRDCTLPLAFTLQVVDLLHLNTLHT